LDSRYRHITGKCGEDAAADFLEKKGFVILERNYRSGKTGEIDIIAGKDGSVVFVEVKKRNSKKFGGALYSIGRKKINSIKNTARKYLFENWNEIQGATFRFDLISVDENGIEWIEDIFR
jgi:putative endonuclease